MFPFWELAVAPVLDAIDTRRVIEIGALRGENTVQMLDRLGPGVELHVIDPVPDFDPREHEEKFPGRYVFHEDLSLNVLDKLPPMDAALIDGDHNWYTVYNECKVLAKVARDNGAPMPVMVLHDVLWPYGRRDLYYGPDDIPAEFRQPYDRRGMSPYKKKLLNGGGMNQSLANAIEEGGPRNGVMTGLEDFMEEYDRPLRLVVLPIYFGLAIVAEEAFLADNPKLEAHLDFLESAEGRFELLELSERIRIDGAVFQQNMFAMYERKISAGTRRYLDLLKGALLDEHYFENEVRIAHLLTCIAQGAPASTLALRDPRRLMRGTADHMVAAKRAGNIEPPDSADFSVEEGSVEREIETLTRYFPFTGMGRVRLDHLESLLDRVRTGGIAGDLVECGTHRGGGAIFLRGYLDAHEMAIPTVWVADRFRAAPEPDQPLPVTAGATPDATEGLEDLLPDLNLVRDAFSRFGLFDDRVKFLQGDLHATLPEAGIERIALLRVGGGLGAATTDVLDNLYDKLAVGGIVVIDDHIEPACAAAVAEFRERRGITATLERVDWAAVYWTKEAEPVVEDEPEPDPEPEVAAVEAVAPSEAPDADTREEPLGVNGLLRRIRRARNNPVAAPVTPTQVTAEVEPEAEPEKAVVAAGSPLAPPVRGPKKDLSVVVVFYNMKREAARSLHALSRSYQEGIEDLDYEVVVVENGSSEDERLGEEYVRSFGPEFRYLDIGAEAHASPVFALNEGVARAGGEIIALMIDGAHILTPGVLRHGMNGSRLYAPAVVSTQQWYVGPGQQPDTMFDGYDQAAEDRLFARAEWPAQGYRLFDIGHFIGGRDWFDGVWESNCLFVPRSVLEQVGAFDESFAMPGGGFSNLEIYERLAGGPDITEATILGEGSFHQVHGGTTTNVPSPEARRDRIGGYAEHYAEIRGKGFRGPNKRVHYVGTMTADAVRSRSRRRTAPAFFTKGMAGDPDGRPAEAVPMPEDIARSYTEAYWHNLGWKKTSWLGRRVARPPADLLTYQDIIHEVRPDWIINTRTGDGGRAMFLASMCDLVGHGQVLSIDDREQQGLPEHDRITYLVAPLNGEETKEKIRAITGGGNVLALLGSATSKRKMMHEFELVHELVGVGSYVIFEDTLVGGHPVWPSFGPGPMDAVKELLAAHLEFVSDTTRERIGVSFNPDGFLKKLR